MIRPYHLQDREALRLLIQLNTPKYFAPDEEQDLMEYLSNEREDYFVFEEKGKVVGAGGINYVEKGGTARISWDIFHPKAQGKGYGSMLTKHRIAIILQKPEVKRIVVRTSQVAYQFYERQGFELMQIVADYWAKDFDLYLMEFNPSTVH